MRNKRPAAFFVLLIIPIVLIFTNRFDNDGWFLLNYGRYIEEFGIPHVEPFTIHQNFHFVMPQWLFAFGLWKFYKAGGMMTMLIYNWIMTIAFFWVYSRLVKLQVKHFSGIIWLFLCFWLFLMSLGMTQRPHTMSGTVFLLEIYFLERSASQKQMPRILIPFFFLLSVLLINLHGTLWPMFSIFLLPYVCESLAGPHLPFGRWELTWKPKDFLFLFLAILAGGFCNPYGTETMTYAFKSYGYRDINTLVSEMHPLVLDFESPYMVILLALLFVCTAVYARHSIPIRQQLLALGTGFMSLQANRSCLLFLLAGVFPLARILAQYSFQPRKSAPYQWSRTRRMVLLMVAASILGTVALFSRTTVSIERQFLYLGTFILFAFLAVCALWNLWKNRTESDALKQNSRILFSLLVLMLLIPFSTAYIRMPRANPVLEKGVDVIQQDAAGSPICLWTGYNDGDYAEYKGIPCYIDARAEVFKPRLNHQKDVMKEYCSLLWGQLDYRDFVTRYPFTHFLTSDLDPLYVNLKNDPRFELLWDSEEDDEIQEKATEVEKKKKVRVYKWRH